MRQRGPLQGVVREALGWALEELMEADVTERRGWSAAPIA